ncbi:MAG TPA: hypothetical protein VIV58_00250 [Kofleriaceae bacterium]
MKKTLAIVASLAIAATVIIVVVVRRNHGPHHHHDSAKTGAVEAVGIDQTDTSVSMMAMLNAPEQATPCLTAYAAIEAEGAAMKLHDGKSMFKWVAPKDAFVAACQALPVEQQQCMAPRYRRDHGDDCQKNRPMPDALAKMYVGLPIVEPNYQR